MTADATLPASDDLTPEVLARWEKLLIEVLDDAYSNFTRVDGEWGSGRATPETDEELRDLKEAGRIVPALLSGVRSRDARITELEAEVATLRQQRHDALESVAARDAVIAKVSELTGQDMTGHPGYWLAADVDAVLESAPSSVLAARDAEKWDEGFAANVLWPATPNPYRAGANHGQ